ncbi:MAG: VOC family protein, partial [Bryobacteraceae bacterium]
MTIPRMTVITLGVADLARATAFYREIFSTSPITEYEGVTFFPLPGVWLSLYPLEKLAEDIAEELKLPTANTFKGFTLAYNARSKEEIAGIFARAAAAGARIAKEPQDTFWGGYSGYFSDPDRHYWEVAWG